MSRDNPTTIDLYYSGLDYGVKQETPNMIQEYNYDSLNNLNQSLRLGIGSYILLLTEHTKFIDETGIEKLVKKIEIHPNIAAVYSDYVTYGKHEYLPSWNNITIFNSNFFIGHAALINRRFLQEINPQLKETFIYELLLRISKQLVVYHVPEPLFSFNVDYKPIQEELTLLRNSYEKQLHQHNQKQ